MKKKITVESVSNGYVIKVESNDEYDYYGYDDIDNTYVETDESGLQRRLGEIFMKVFNFRNCGDGVVTMTIE